MLRPKFSEETIGQLLMPSGLTTQSSLLIPLKAVWMRWTALDPKAGYRNGSARFAKWRFRLPTKIRATPVFYLRLGAAPSTMRTTSAMMRFNSKSFGV
jgi:hypothetical protein